MRSSFGVQLGSWLMVLGGWDGETECATADIYEPSLDRWLDATTELGKLHPMQMRHGHTAERSGTGVIMIGGVHRGRHLPVHSCCHAMLRPSKLLAWGKFEHRGGKASKPRPISALSSLSLIKTGAAGGPWLAVRAGCGLAVWGFAPPCSRIQLPASSNASSAICITEHTVVALDGSGQVNCWRIDDCSKNQQLPARQVLLHAPLSAIGAVIRLQSTWRGLIGRRRAAHLKASRAEAACTIQSCCRAIVAVTQALVMARKKAIAIICAALAGMKTRRKLVHMVAHAAAAGQVTATISKLRHMESHKPWRAGAEKRKAHKYGSTVLECSPHVQMVGSSTRDSKNKSSPGHNPVLITLRSVCGWAAPLEKVFSSEELSPNIASEQPNSPPPTSLDLTQLRLVNSSATKQSLAAAQPAPPVTHQPARTRCISNQAVKKSQKRPHRPATARRAQQFPVPKPPAAMIRPIKTKQTTVRPSSAVQRRQARSQHERKRLQLVGNVYSSANVPHLAPMTERIGRRWDKRILE